MFRFFGNQYRDMARMEHVLRESEIDWTILRPPRLTDGPKTGHSRTAINARLRRAFKISRADLAGAMLELVDDPESSRAAIAIAH